MACDCEACEDCCPCIGGFPQLWSVFALLLVGGGCLTGSAMYGLISLRTSILNFTWAAPWGIYLNAAALGTAVGVFMLVLALLTWCAFHDERAAKVFKAVFAGALLLCCVGAILTAAGALKVVLGFKSQRSGFTRAFEKAWLEERNKPTGGNHTRVICTIQDRLGCTGWFPGDCGGIRAGDEARCDTNCKPPSGTRGCYFPISAFYRRWNLPLSILAILAGLCALVAFGVLVATVSFSLDMQKGNV